MRRNQQRRLSQGSQREDQEARALGSVRRREPAAAPCTPVTSTSTGTSCLVCKEGDLAQSCGVEMVGTEVWLAPRRVDGGKQQPQNRRRSKERGQELVAPPDCSPLLPASRSTIFVRLHTNGNQELQYQPGDHLGVFPGNHEDLVNALIERLEDAPPANQLVNVELLEERSTALGNRGLAHLSTPRAVPSPQGRGDPFLVPITKPGRRAGLCCRQLMRWKILHFSWPNTLGPTG